jgi:hypothetical protein
MESLLLELIFRRSLTQMGKYYDLERQGHKLQDGYVFGYSFFCGAR